MLKIYSQMKENGNYVYFLPSLDSEGIFTLIYSDVDKNLEEMESKLAEMVESGKVTTDLEVVDYFVSTGNFFRHADDKELIYRNTKKLQMKIKSKLDTIYDMTNTIFQIALKIPNMQISDKITSLCEELDAIYFSYLEEIDALEEIENEFDL